MYIQILVIVTGMERKSYGQSVHATCTKRNSATMKNKPTTLKKLPVLQSDEEVEDFVDTADLTEYDLSEMKPYRFEFEKKEARVNMRLPGSLLDAVKNKAQQRGIPYQRFIREAIEKAVESTRKKAS
jgi:predicted DNA binding CopG/RHH family protein